MVDVEDSELTAFVDWEDEETRDNYLYDVDFFERKKFE
jgi:hypothetical protein